MIKINRLEFLQRLELVRSGLSPQGIIDQSDCVVFLNGAIHTFNGEVSCRHEKGLDGVTGAVKAGPLTTQLGKWKEDELDIEVEDDSLWVYGMKKKARLNMEAEVLLPVSTIERPDDWHGCGRGLESERGELRGRGDSGV